MQREHVLAAIAFAIVAAMIRAAFAGSLREGRAAEIDRLRSRREVLA